MKTLYSHSTKIIAALLLLFIVSCKKNYEDPRLKDQIVGRWKSTNYLYRSYTFNEDNTFIDTLLEYTNNIYSVREIIAGDYLIDNGELVFQNIHLVYFKGQEDEHILSSGQSYDAKFIISFQGDVLSLKQKDVFELANGTHSGILGKWNHDKLVAIYDYNIENKFTGGIVKGVYDFSTDLTVDYQYQYIYSNIVSTPYHWKATYDLTDSKLTVNQWSVYNVNVSFTKNKMIWLYDDLTFKREQ